MPNLVLSVHERVNPQVTDANEPESMQEAPLLTIPEVSFAKSTQVDPERYWSFREMGGVKVPELKSFLPSGSTGFV